MRPDDETTPDILSEIKWLRSLASRIVADGSAADDVVQDAAHAAIRSNRRPQDPTRTQLRQWLAGVVRNVQRSRSRKDRSRAQRERETAPDEALPSAHELAVRAEHAKLLIAAVLELPPHLREVVLLRHYEGESPTAIGARIGAPASTIRARLTRAHQKLRERLEGELGGSRGLGLALVTSADTRVLEGYLVAAPSTLNPLLLPLLSIVNAKAIFVVSMTLVLLGGGWGLSRNWTSVGGTVDLPSGGAPIEDPLQGPLTVGPSVVETIESRTDAVAEFASLDGFALAPAPVSSQNCCIVGVVMAAEGPVAGATVTAEAAIPTRVSALRAVATDEPEILKTTTDGQGRFSLEVHADSSYCVWAEDALRAPAFALDARAGDVLHLQLEMGAALTLTVVDSKGTPLENVECGIRRSGWSRVGLTATSGRLVLDRLPIDATMAWADAPTDTLVSARRRLELISGMNSLELKLVDAAVLLGQVRDAETSSPIAGARVELHSSSSSTDAGGRFRIGGIRPGRNSHLVIETHATGYAPAATQIQVPGSSGETDVIIELEQGLEARIRVVDSAGAAVSGATISASSLVHASQFSGATMVLNGTSDGAGNVEFAGVTRDSAYEILAIASGYGAGTRIVDTSGASFSAALGSAPLDFGEVVLSPACSIEGRVAPDVGDVELVVLEFIDAGHVMTVDSRSIRGDRTFEFDGISAGHWRLACLPDESGGWTQSQPAACYTSVHLRPGEALTHLVLSKGEEFRGRAVDAEGEGASDLVVVLESEGGETVEGTTDQEGRFTLALPGAGPYSLEIIDLRLRFATWTDTGVDVGPPLTIELAPLRTSHEINGRLLMPSDEPIPEAVYVHFVHVPSGRALRRVAIPDDEGWFTMKNLENVSYDLSLVDFAGHFEPISIDSVVPGGEAVELVLVRR